MYIDIHKDKPLYNIRILSFKLVTTDRFKRCVPRKLSRDRVGETPTTLDLYIENVQSKRSKDPALYLLKLLLYLLIIVLYLLTGSRVVPGGTKMVLTKMVGGLLVTEKKKSRRPKPEGPRNNRIRVLLVLNTYYVTAPVGAEPAGPGQHTSAL
jgi:hypothetical protein